MFVFGEKGLCTDRAKHVGQGVEAGVWGGTVGLFPPRAGKEPLESLGRRQLCHNQCGVVGERGNHTCSKLHRLLLQHRVLHMSHALFEDIHYVLQRQCVSLGVGVGGCGSGFRTWFVEVEVVEEGCNVFCRFRFDMAVTTESTADAAAAMWGGDCGGHNDLKSRVSVWTHES